MGDNLDEEGPGGAPTQLADSRPQLDQPLRVTIPVNAPARKVKQTQDKHIQKNAFSPMALSQTKRAMPELLGLAKANEESKRSVSEAGASAGQAEASTKTAVSDFTMLAFSSKRSGKKDVEAMAYVSLGVIYDNQGNHTQAIEIYQQYADLCEEMGDVTGVACAYNCLGVDYMLLACPPSDSGFVGGTMRPPSPPCFPPFVCVRCAALATVLHCMDRAPGVLRSVSCTSCAACSPPPSPSLPW